MDATIYQHCALLAVRVTNLTFMLSSSSCIKRVNHINWCAGLLVGQCLSSLYDLHHDGGFSVEWVCVSILKDKPIGYRTDSEHRRTRRRSG